MAAVLCCLLAVTGCAGGAPGAARPSPYPHPGALYTRSSLARLAELRRGPSPDPALEALLAEARAALGRRAAPVEDFRIPPYYREPDAHMAAKASMSGDARAAFALALGSWIAEEPEGSRFRDAAAGILAAWAGTNRRVSGSDGDLVICYTGIPLVLAADLVWDEPGWRGTASRERFGAWVRTVFLPSARRARARANNHGDWGTAASIASAWLLDDQAAVAADVAHLRRRIDRNIDATGELPLENRRTSSGMWYTYFALAPMTLATMIARNATGVDLFRYVSPRGRSLRLALDRYWRYCLAPETWPYRRPGGLLGAIYNQIYQSAPEVRIPAAWAWPGDLYEVMAAVYGSDEWSAWVRSSRPLAGERGWIHPSVMRLALGGGR